MAAATGEAAVADDTGLEVDALGGAPGVWAARYAGEDATYADNVAKLLAELDGVPPGERAGPGSAPSPGARGPTGGRSSPRARRGRDRRRGAGASGGFGYDPVFVPDDAGGRTFAEMTSEEKNAMSHRARAFRRLAERLRDV